MIIGVFGNLSAGKTALSSIFLYKAHEQGKRIITNIQFKYSNLVLPYENLIDAMYREVDSKLPAEQSIFFKSWLLVDELHVYANSHRSGSDLNLTFNAFISQLGKLDCNLIYSSQTFESQVDKFIRELGDLFFFIERVDSNLNPVIDDRIVDYPVFIKGEMWLKRYGGAAWIRKRFCCSAEAVYSMYQTRERVLIDREKYLKTSKKHDAVPFVPKI